MSGPTDRLFFAALPDPAAAARIDQFRNRLALGHALTGRFVATGRLHVTLMFLGDFEGLSEPFLAAALRAAGTIRMRPFLAGFDRAMSFRARVPAGPLVLVGGDGVEGFRTLRSHMVEAMAGQGIRGFEASFTPHMTLSYDGQTIKEQFVDLLTWPVREFQLLRSVVGERRYIELGRWTLSGDNF